MKEKFYVFLDIDGVLNSLSFHNQGFSHYDLEFEAVDALNYLNKKINKSFDLDLVVSSARGVYPEDVISLFFGGDVEFRETMNFTKKLPNKHRGLEISNYLNGKENAENILIIDDVIENILECFKREQIIKTNYYVKSLRKSDVNDFFDSEYYKKIKHNMLKRRLESAWGVNQEREI